MTSGKYPLWASVSPFIKKETELHKRSPGSLLALPLSLFVIHHRPKGPDSGDPFAGSFSREQKPAVSQYSSFTVLMCSKVHSPFCILLTSRMLKAFCLSSSCLAKWEACGAYRIIWFPEWVLPLTRDSGQVLYLSKPQFPLLYNGNNPVLFLLAPEGSCLDGRRSSVGERFVTLKGLYQEELS